MNVQVLKVKDAKRGWTMSEKSERSEREKQITDRLYALGHAKNTRIPGDDLVFITIAQSLQAYEQETEAHPEKDAADADAFFSWRSAILTLEGCLFPQDRVGQFRVVAMSDSHQGWDSRCTRSFYLQVK